MDEIIKVLRKLGVLDIINKTFLDNNIEQNDENMKNSGFGFAKITESFASTLVLSEEVNDFISCMREKQDNELAEQLFALTGFLTLDSNNNPIIYLNSFIEDTDGVHKPTSTGGGDNFYQSINKYLNDHSKTNKVLLFGHTHPDMEKLKASMPIIDEYNSFREAAETLSDNPLKIRKRGLNISVGDIIQLINAQNSATRTNFILSGVSLANGEFNVLFYDGSTIQSLDNIFVVRGELLEPIQTFRTDSTIIKQ